MTILSGFICNTQAFLFCATQSDFIFATLRLRGRNRMLTSLAREKGARTMSELLEQKCIPCSGSLPPATAEEISNYKTEIPEWNLINENGELRLQRVFKFPDFKSAISFTNSIGEIAEAEGHHPALLTEWGKVTVTWWTHALKALHHNDFIMAAKSDAIMQKDN